MICEDVESPLHYQHVLLASEQSEIESTLHLPSHAMWRKGAHRAMHVLDKGDPKRGEFGQSEAGGRAETENCAS